MSKARFNKQNLWHKICGCFLILVAILVPATVGGMKNLDVGVDIGPNVVGLLNTIDVQNRDFSRYMSEDIHLSNEITVNTEPGYKVLIYALSLFSMDPHFILFALQFLTILFVMLFAYKCRNKTSMTFVMLIYMLVWYYQSFSIMRQGFAMSVSFFAAALLMDKKYLWSIFWLLIAFTIHSSSLVMLVAFALIVLSQSRIREKIKSIIYGIYAGILLICGIFFNQIIYFLVEVTNILPEQYSKFFAAPEGIDTNWSTILVALCFIIAAIVYLKYGKQGRVDGRLTLSLLITNLVFVILSFNVDYIYRFGHYFEILGLFLLVPNLPLMTKNTTKRIVIATASVTVLFSLFWYRMIVHNWANMVPYRSDILHISLDIENRKTDEIAMEIPVYIDRKDKI